MTGLVSGLLLAIVAPLVMVLPGYLVLGLLRGREDVSKGDLVETLGISAAISLALVVLVAFALSQTVGLTRWTTVATFAVLLAGLGLLYRSRAAGDGAAPDDGSRPQVARGQTTTSGWSLSPRTGPVVLLGVTLAIVATGALIYDGSEPYSQAYYANASEVEPIITVEPGQPVSWTIVVENHEQGPANYTIETMRIPQANASEEDPPSVALDQAKLGLEPGDNTTYEVGFTAPEAGLWKVQTSVHVDGKAEPLTMHRWIAANTS